MLTAPFTLSSRYRCDRLLGRGGFADVWHAVDESMRQEVAVKVFLRQDARGQELCREEFVRTMRIQHPNIIRLLDFGTHEGMPYIVMPFLAKSTPQDRAGHLTEPELWRIAADVAIALEHIHNLSPAVIHNDLKPDNILTTDNDRFVLTDFGISMELFERLSQQVEQASGEGPRAYRAPEMFHFGDSRRRTPVKATDVWAFGACLFELASGEPPFGDQGGLFQKIRYSETGAGVSALVEPLPGRFSGRLTDLIYRCLDCETWNRPTAGQVRQNAEDWLRSYEAGFQAEPENTLASPKPAPEPAPEPARAVHHRTISGKSKPGKTWLGSIGRMDTRSRKRFFTMAGLLAISGLLIGLAWSNFWKMRSEPTTTMFENPDSLATEPVPIVDVPFVDSTRIKQLPNQFFWKLVDKAIEAGRTRNMEDYKNYDVLLRLKKKKDTATQDEICAEIRQLDGSRTAAKGIVEYANDNFSCNAQVGLPIPSSDIKPVTNAPGAGESAGLIKLKYFWMRLDDAMLTSQAAKTAADSSNLQVLKFLKDKKSTAKAAEICAGLKKLDNSRNAVKNLLEYANQNFACGIEPNSAPPQIQSPTPVGGGESLTSTGDSKEKKKMNGRYGVCISTMSSTEKLDVERDAFLKKHPELTSESIIFKKVEATQSKFDRKFSDEKRRGNYRAIIQCDSRYKADALCKQLNGQDKQEYFVVEFK